MIQFILGFIVTLWLFFQFQGWFTDTFPKITEYLNVIVGAIAVWIGASIFFGLAGFFFVFLLYGILLVNEIYYGIINFFRAKNKK